MDLEIEKVYQDWVVLERENMEYHRKLRKKKAVYLILSFLNLIVYYMRLMVDYLEKEKKKIDKRYYSIDDLD